MKMNCRGVDYEVNMKGQGAAVLMLHGFTGSGSTWQKLASGMSDRFLCIMPDLMGHGKTDSPDDPGRYHMEEAVQDLHCMLLELGISKVHVIGYSMGGRLALAFASLYPHMVSSLVLESASPGLKGEAERKARIKQDCELAAFILEEGVEAFVEYWQSIPLFQSQQVMPASIKGQLHRDRLNNSGAGLANSLLGMGTGMQDSYWEQLSSVQTPTLLITGSLDDKFCKIAGKMRLALPNCRWEVVQGSGHAIHVEDSEMFGRIVSEFVDNWRES